MRLVFLLLALTSVAASLKCYVGVVDWVVQPKNAGLKLKDCAEQCCSVSWGTSGAIYSCGKECPNAGKFVKGENCEQGQGDSSWCFCNGLVGQCKPKF